MTKTASSAMVLDHECIAFAMYLIHQNPNSYVLDKYREAHRSSTVLRNLKPASADAVLLNVSRMHPLATKLVDCYTAVFYRGSTVRKKMVLLLAILESCAPTHAYFDSTDSWNTVQFSMRMFQQGLTFILSLVLATILFTPIQLLYHVGTWLSLLLGKTASQARARVRFPGPMEKQSSDRASSAELPPDFPVTH